MTPDEIRGLRERLGWTQVRLAESLGVSHRAVVYWEAGRRTPGGAAVMSMTRLAEAKTKKEGARRS